MLSLLCIVTFWLTPPFDPSAPSLVGSSLQQSSTASTDHAVTVTFTPAQSCVVSYALVDAVASPTWQGVVACAAGVQGGATLASCADASM